MKYWYFALLFASPSVSFGAGAWYWNPTKLEQSFKNGLKPDFIIARAGTFDSRGKITPLFVNEWPKVCKQHSNSSAWLSYKIKRGMSLSIEVGEKLAVNINKMFEGTCFDRIELDVEPIFKPDKWILAFYKSVRLHLSSRFKLDVTIESPSPGRLPSDTQWTKEDAEGVLKLVDGIDIMNYDTGLGDLEEYENLIFYSEKQSLEILNENSNKQIRFGAPAYQDKTKIHDPRIENLHSVLIGFQKLEEERKGLICNGRFQISYFDGSDMNKEDLKMANDLEGWQRSVCK
jgi:hypothetical protein